MPGPFGGPGIFSYCELDSPRATSKVSVLASVIHTKEHMHTVEPLASTTVKQLKIELLREVYCLVTARVLEAASLATYLGFVTPAALRAFVRRANIPHSKQAGLARMAELEEKGLTPTEYVRGLAQALGEEQAARGPDVIQTRLPSGTLVSLTKQQQLELAKDYSNFWQAGGDANSIAAKYGMTREDLAAYCREHGIKRGGPPLPKGCANVDINSLPIPDPMEEAAKLLEKRRLAELTKAATKWHLAELERKQVNFAVSKYTPPATVKKIDFSTDKRLPSRKLIVNMSDWQLGAVAQGEELMNGDDWNTEKALTAIRNYMGSIAEHIATSRCKYDEIMVCSVGDLGHGLQGFTASGTELEVDVYRQRQTRAIFDSVIGLIEGCRQLAPKVSVYSVEDNHLGYTNELIMDQVAFWYGGARPVKDVEVHRNSSPIQYIPVGDETLLVLYHGATGRPGRGELDKGGGRERNAYYLIHEAVRRYPKHTKVHIITGHVHHRIQEEFAHFTLHTLGTLVKGDVHADSLLLGSRGQASQSIFEVNPKTGMVYDIPIPVQTGKD